jgi:hypothetical protein
MVEQTNTKAFQVQRRREYLGHFAYQYVRWADESSVYLTVGETVWDTLERVVPEVEV